MSPAGGEFQGIQLLEPPGSSVGEPGQPKALPAGSDVAAMTDGRKQQQIHINEAEAAISTGRAALGCGRDYGGVDPRSLGPGQWVLETPVWGHVVS